MGTRFTIQVYAEPGAELAPAVDAAWDRLEELNGIFSDYDPQSELMRFCRAPAGTRVALSPELHEILSLSQRIARRTGGAFDVTIGPLKRLWKQTRRDARLPSPDQLAAAFQRTGFEKLTLYPDGTASLAVEGMRLDLGGIAKGFASRELVGLFEREGFPCVLVAASGDVAVGAAPPGEGGWRVGVATSDRVVELAPHSAISTSGDSQQFIEIEGTRYSHIVDPETGLGLTHETLVSVRGPDAAWTDALATAVSVLGSPKRLAAEVRAAYHFSFLPGTSDG